MSIRYLRAEELARFAGLAKSTVLAAIRRGELTSSRTLGRGTRIAPDTARAFLEARGCAVPSELRDARRSAIAVVSDAPAVHDAATRAARDAWHVAEARPPYATLLWIGAHRPAVVIVDLALGLLNPLEIIRALRGSAAVPCVLAVSADAEQLAGALAAGAEHAVRAYDIHALARALSAQPPGATPS